MTDRIYARPTIPFLCALIAGLLVGDRLPGYALWVAPAWGGVLSVILYRLRRERGAHVWPLLLFLLSGYLAIQPWRSPHFAEGHVVHLAGGRVWRIGGTVADEPLFPAKRVKFVLVADSVASEGVWRPLHGRVRVTLRGEAPDLRRGARVRLSARVREIRNFSNPGGFDFRRHMAFRRVWVTAYGRTTDLESAPNPPQGLFSDRLFALRQAVGDRIAAVDGPHPPENGRGLLKALLLGERRSIAPAWRRDFNRAGVGHLLAISGLHVGIVAAVAFWCLKWMLSFSSALLWRALPAKLAAALTLVPVVLYGLLAGFPPSTQRAVLMVAVFLAALVVGKEADSLNTLAVAALTILIIDPPSLFSLSFQLSFVAVLAILCGVAGERAHPRPDAGPPVARVGRRLLASLRVSLWAVIGTAPLVMTAFSQFSLVGVAANVLLIPWIGFGVVPLGLAGVGLTPLSPWLADRALQGCLWVLAPALDLIHWIASLRLAAIDTPAPTPFESVCYYLFVAAALVWRRSQRPEVRRLCRAAVVLPLVLLAADSAYWWYARFGHRDLKVTVLDVGQGSATLLELPGGHTLLVDGGGFSDNAVFDVGARLVAPVLRHKRIFTLDTLVLSHPNSDHMNGLIHIVENFTVREVWSNHEAAATAGYRRFAEAVNRRGIPWKAFGALPRDRTIGGVRLQVLYPGTDFAAQVPLQRHGDCNDNSIVLRASLGTTAFLLPGDLMATGERDLLRRQDGRLKSTVLLAPHHGSRKSSTAAFVQQVRPAVVLVSAGWQNRFGFPHAEVLARYRACGTDLWRTDLHGALCLSSDGRRVALKAVRRPYGRSEALYK